MRLNEICVGKILKNKDTDLRYVVIDVECQGENVTKKCSAVRYDSLFSSVTKFNGLDGCDVINIFNCGKYSNVGSCEVKKYSTYEVII